MGGHSSLLGVSVTKINVSSGIKIDDNLYPSISAAPQNNQSSNGDSMWRSELVEYTFCIYTFWLLSWLPRRSREGFFTTAPNVFLRLFDTREPFFSRLFWGFRRLRKPPELLMAAKRILCHRERIPDWQVIRSNPWLSGLTVKVCLKEKKKKRRHEAAASDTWVDRTQRYSPGIEQNADRRLQLGRHVHDWKTEEVKSLHLLTRGPGARHCTG